MENRWKEGGEEGGRMKEREIRQDWRIDENKSNKTTVTNAKATNANSNKFKQ